MLEGRGWSVERYIARQSLISAGTSADVSRMDLSGLTSAFVRRSFLSDAAGDLEAQLAEAADAVIEIRAGTPLLLKGECPWIG